MQQICWRRACVWELQVARLKACPCCKVKQPKCKNCYQDSVLAKILLWNKWVAELVLDLRRCPCCPPCWQPLPLLALCLFQGTKLLGPTASHRSPKPSITRCLIILCPEQARTFEVKGRGMRTQILKVDVGLENWFLCSFQMNELRCNQQISM